MSRAAELSVGDNALRQENLSLRRLRRVVSLTTQLLLQGDYTRAQAERLVAWARAEALRLFPGKEAAFEIIYGSKFDRLMSMLYGHADRRDSH